MTKQLFCKMKKLLLSATLIACNALILVGQPTQKGYKNLFKQQTSKNSIKTEKSNARLASSDLILPTTRTTFHWDDNTQEWHKELTYAISYDQNGNKILEVQVNGTDTLSKTTYKYDDQGNQIEESIYYRNILTLQLDLSFSNKIEIIKDGNGRIVERKLTEFSHNQDEWFEEKEEWIYTGNNDAPNEIKYYYWDGYEFVFTHEITSIVWRNYAEHDMLSYSKKLENFDGYRYSYSSTSTNNGVELTETLQAGEWTNKSRRITLEDEKGNEAGYKYERWENGAWVHVQSNIVTNTYNELGILTESISEVFNQNALKNLSKTVYSDFINLTITGVEAFSSENLVKAYPNPFTNQVSIESAENLKISVYTLQNNLIMAIELNQGQTTLQLDHLQAGIYLLKTESKNGKVSTQKIIKK
jgi:hypothetical protein